MNRVTAHQRRMNNVQEIVYEELREYQKGSHTPLFQSGVVAGQLDIALTSVMDTIVRRIDAAINIEKSAKKAPRRRT